MTETLCLLALAVLILLSLLASANGRWDWAFILTVLCMLPVSAALAARAGRGGEL